MELLVGVALALVVAGLILGLLLVGRRWSKGTVDRADFQRMGLLTVNHVMHTVFGARELIHPLVGESRGCAILDRDFVVHVYAFDEPRRLLVHRILDPATGALGPERVVATHLRAVRFSSNGGTRLLRVKMAFSPADERVRKRDVYVLSTEVAIRD